MVIVDPRPKVEPRHHAHQIEQPDRRCQWTGDTLVSPSLRPPALSVLIPSGSFNDVQALEHNDIHFRSSDVITAGGLYFS
jgi:hypothetical protein